MNFKKEDIYASSETNSNGSITMYIVHCPTDESVMGNGVSRSELNERLIDELKVKVFERIATAL